MQVCLFFLFFFSSLFASDTILTENDPSFLVEGVSVISGDFYEYAEDYVVQGAEPIRIKHACLPSSFPLESQHLISKYSSHVLYGGFRLTVTEPNGTAFVYQPSSLIPRHVDREECFVPVKRLGSYGITNTASGRISARTNVQNHLLWLDRQKSPKNPIPGFTFYAADGTIRRYRAAEGQERQKVGLPDNKGGFTAEKAWLAMFFRLEKEELPNGKVMRYIWDHQNHLSKIFTTNQKETKVYASLTLRETRKDPEYCFYEKNGSDGGFISYQRKKQKILIQSSQLPSQEYSYSLEGSEKETRHLIQTMTLPENRKLKIEYKKHSYQQRVHSLSQPLHSDGSFIKTHRFSYDFEKKQTQLLDAYGNQTLYFWNDQARPKKIERFNGKDLYNAEKFVWNSIKLTCKSLFDGKRSPVSSRVLSYDSSGNVLEETFWGNLSGKGKVLQISPDNKPLDNGAERSVKKNFYNERNLTIRQEDPNGLVTLTGYREDCCLPSFQELSDGKEVTIRKTFDYDEDLTLVRETTNEGIVTLIRETTPRSQDPFIGMPEIIDEKDTRGTLLKRSVLHYHPSGLVSQIDVYDSNQALRYSLYKDYDEKGRLTRETNALGQEALYQYDKVGNCISIKGFSGRLETICRYDLGNRLIEKEEIGDDGICHLTKYAHNHRHHLTSEIDPYGNETRYVCNPFGQRIETQFPAIPSSDGSFKAPVLFQKWDCSGNEMQTIDAEGYITQKSYNAYNKPISVIHPDGSREEMLYYLDGSLKSHTDTEGITTSYTYNVLSHVTSKSISFEGKLLFEERFEYAGNSLMAKIDAEGNRTTYTYDSAGRKASEEFCEETTLYFYDELGRQNLIQKGDLQIIKEYDLLGRVIEEKHQSAAGQLLRKERYEYDTANHCIAIFRNINGQEAKESFRYDSKNRLIWKQDPLGAIETTLYEDTPHRKTHTDAMGLQTIETYDAQNRIHSLEKRKEKTLSLEEKFYDLRGNLSSQINTIYAPDGSSRTIHTRWEYDNRGRLITLIEADGTSDAKITRHTYTPNGKKKTTIKPDGVVLTYNYNGLGHLILLTSSDSTVNHSMDYDRLGNLITSDKVQRTLDAKGRILSETFPQGHSILSRYDTQGRRFQCQIPKANCSIEYRYNAFDLQCVERKTLEGKLLYIHRYGERDLAGNSLIEKTIDGATINYVIDPLSRRTSLQTPYFTQKILEFDPVGNICRMQIQHEENTYTYNDQYQLTEETGLFQCTYAYDSLYNRLQKGDEIYEINALNQTISHCTYDLNGNPIRSKDTQYSYDALDRLIRLEMPGLIETFTYDSEHRCLSKTTFKNEKKQVLHFLYDGNNEIGAFDESQQIQELRILGEAPRAEIGAAIAIELQDQAYVPIHDLQGNLAALINTSPEEQSTYYRYSAFGEEKISNSINSFEFCPEHSLSPWRFSSKRSDRDTRLVYYGRRFYIPEHGRWLTPDPAGFSDGMNLYAFVHNDPLTHLDLYGLLLFPMTSPTTAQMDLWMQHLDKQNQIWKFRSGELASDHSYFRYDPGMKPVSLAGSRPRGEVFFFSGIRTEFAGREEFTGMVKYISDLGGGIPVHGVHMPTYGFSDDVLNCRHTFKTQMNATILQIEKRLKEASERIGPDGRILVFAHSAGAMNAFFGGMRLQEKVRNQIDFRGIAPAKIVPEHAFGSVGNYMSSNHDLLMTYHKYGDKKEYKRALQSGLLQQIPAHPNASKMNDHGFMSPTFKDTIELFLKQFSVKHDCR